MKTRADLDILKNIFSDAHVVDFDISEWDKGIALWMLADHYEDWTSRCPLVVVTFHGVKRLTIYFNEPVVKPKLGSHLQWLIHDFELVDTNDRISLKLWGHAASPIMEIECRRIDVDRAAHSVLDELFPGWNDPGRPLARPGPAVLHGLIRKRTGKDTRR